MRQLAVNDSMGDFQLFLDGCHRQGAEAVAGQTEGHITKLKLVKRQMYGRGKLDLLQARVIGAA